MNSDSTRTGFRKIDGYQQITVDLVVALRGRRSRRAFGNLLGYKSNMVQRWETGECWPKAGHFLSACESSLKRGLRSAYKQMFHRELAFECTPEYRYGGLVAFLRELRGRQSILEIAAACDRSRFTVSRWLRGQAEPTVPELLQLIEVMSDRLLDFLSGLIDVSKLPSLASEWQELELSRTLAYQQPWGHAVMRAIRLDACPKGQRSVVESWIARRLSLNVSEVRPLLDLLQRSGHLRWSGRAFVTKLPVRVDTGKDRELARTLKEHWASVALERQRADAPGSFGYSLFEISFADLRKIKELHSSYAQALQAIVAKSTGTDRVALYCAQLLDLSHDAQPL